MPGEEAHLLTLVRELPLAPSRYREFMARRRIVSFGGRYDFSHHEIHEAPPVPEFLHPVRERMARWAEVDAERLVYALVTEYAPGTPIGWHRDAPEFDVTLGLSLLGHARLRFRPYRSARTRRTEAPDEARTDAGTGAATGASPSARRSRADILSVELAPRSAYVIAGDARWRWQHSIPPVSEPRFSITFRTKRDRRAPAVP